eukprot:1698380-Lingulodinium_polyedra.AAC.1
MGGRHFTGGCGHPIHKGRRDGMLMVFATGIAHNKLLDDGTLTQTPGQQMDLFHDLQQKSASQFKGKVLTDLVPKPSSNSSMPSFASTVSDRMPPEDADDDES